MSRNPAPPRKEFKRRINALGLTVRQFALAWGLHVRTVYNWVSGSKDKYPPSYAWRMLAITEANPKIILTLNKLPLIGKEQIPQCEH